MPLTITTKCSGNIDSAAAASHGSNPLPPDDSASILRPPPASRSGDHPSRPNSPIAPLHPADGFGLHPRPGLDPRRSAPKQAILPDDLPVTTPATGAAPAAAKGPTVGRSAADAIMRRREFKSVAQIH